MNFSQKRVKVAVVQAAPVIMDAQRTLEKTLDLLSEACSKGAELVVFPEGYIPCYPKAITFGSVIGWRTQEGRDDWRRDFGNAVDIPGPISDRLAKAAGEHKVFLSIGVIEREYGTLYCTNVFYGPDGSYLGKHRKLKPTAVERLVWGEGDGSTLTTVDTPFGRMGSVICWENYMPLMRAAMYSKGINIYLAPTADYRETWIASMRHIAREGLCFVLSCNMCFGLDDYPGDLKTMVPEEEIPKGIVNNGIVTNGGSTIVDPFGEFVVEPVFDKEAILVAELDLNKITAARMDFDSMGHYSRPDIFHLTVNEKKMPGVECINSEKDTL